MNEKTLAMNRRAQHDYFLEEALEAGISLSGSEVKSLRDGRVNFKDGYVRIVEEEAFLVGVHIGTYVFAHQFNHEPERRRKLLLHKSQIRKLLGKTKQSGITIVPVKFYLKKDWIKLEIALARGKKKADVRETLKAKDAARDIAQAMKRRR